MTGKPGKKVSEETKAKIRARWSHEARKKHAIKCREAELGRTSQIRTFASKGPHPDNAGTRYVDFPIPINNIHDHSACYRVIEYDETNDWVPVEDENFLPTSHAPGSLNKIFEMRARLEKGYPLWHPEDLEDMTGYDVEVPGAMPSEVYVADLGPGRKIDRLIEDYNKRKSEDG